MNPMHIPIRILLQCALLLLTGRVAAVMAAESGMSHAGHFPIIPESQAYSDSFGMLMICPAHAHGTPDEAFAKLNNLLQQRSAEQISSIWVCRSKQLGTLKRLSQLVDRIVVNPFVRTSDKKPVPDKLVWSHFDHPVANYLRELRVNANDKQLVACIDLRGEPVLFKERQASFKEIQWMVHAAIGANFQGLVWRGDLNAVPWLSRFRQMENNLQRHAEDLGSARPVRWATASGKEAVAAICSEKMLFVVLLSPDYLVPTNGKKEIRFPVEPSLCKGHVILTPPAELSILSGETLSGKPLLLHRDEGQVRVDYCFRGSSEILVFQLSHGPPTAETRTIPELGDYADFKQKALLQHQTEYFKIVTSHQQDPALQRFGEQLDLIDEVVTRLIRILQILKDSSLDSLLGDIKMNPADATPPKTHVSATSALDILSDYQDLFTYQASLPTATKQEQTVLGEYYRASLKCAQDYTADRVRLLTIMHESNLGHILPLSIVVQFLYIPDSDWSADYITSLPKWMQQLEYLHILEEFSLHARRPLTAYQFALSQGKYSGRTIDKFDYLYTAAFRMINNRDYHAGISCLKAGIAAASGESEHEVLVDLRLKLAKVLESTGHLQLAADETKQVVDEYPESPQYGKAAALRLKYLYEMSQFIDILQESPKYQADDRCQAYLPQILYTSWVAHRHEKQLEAAGELQNDFLSRFPNHQLAAHMYFASAKTALGASDYGEALRLLRIIQDRCPKSSIMQKVKQIKDQLEKGRNSTTE